MGIISSALDTCGSGIKNSILFQSGTTDTRGSDLMHLLGDEPEEDYRQNQTVGNPPNSKIREIDKKQKELLNKKKKVEQFIHRQESNMKQLIKKLSAIEQKLQNKHLGSIVQSQLKQERAVLKSQKNAFDQQIRQCLTVKNNILNGFYTLENMKLKQELHTMFQDVDVSYMMKDMQNIMKSQHKSHYALAKQNDQLSVMSEMLQDYNSTIYEVFDEDSQDARNNQLLDDTKTYMPPEQELTHPMIEIEEDVEPSENLEQQQLTEQIFS